jgi:hypothetical protein
MVFYIELCNLTIALLPTSATREFTSLFTL